MTRSQRPDRPRAPRPAGSGLSGLIPEGVPFAAILSIVGLVVIGFLTMGLMSGKLPFLPSGTSGGGNQPGATNDPKDLRTPTPSYEVVVPSVEPGIVVPGTLLYVKAGNVWLQSNGQAKQLTDSGTDSMASFSGDGKFVWFVRTRRVEGAWNVDGTPRNYRMDVPSLMRVSAGGGDTTKVLDGIVDPSGRLKWMGFIQNPVISPDGTTIAMTTDLPDPTQSDVTLKLMSVKGRRITDLKLEQVPPLGHQDPAWKPDGSLLAYVRNDRDGAKGTPRIYTYDPKSKKAKAVTGPGYIHPAWSPDGRYLAATKTNAYGTDVVVIDARTGLEVLNVTGDGDSWAPTWSPAGNQIAFLHVSGRVVDLRLAQLDGTAPAWTVKDTIDLTENAGLDSVSRPGWFIPADQVPAATDTPAASTPASSDASTAP